MQTRVNKNLTQLQNDFKQFNTIADSYLPYLGSLYRPDCWVLPYPDTTAISQLQSVSMVQTLTVSDTPNLENSYRIITKANTCFQGNAIQRYGRDPVSTILGWWYIGQITGTQILDDENTYQAIRSVSSILRVKCTTRVATTLDVNGVISGGSLLTLPPDFDSVRINQFLDYCVPGSAILNESIMDGAVVLQPFTPFLGFRRPSDPQNTGVFSWYRTPALTNLSYSEVCYYTSDTSVFKVLTPGPQVIVAEVGPAQLSSYNMQSPGEPVEVRFSMTSSVSQATTIKARIWWNCYDPKTNTFYPYFEINLGIQQPVSSMTFNSMFSFVVPTIWQKVQIIYTSAGANTISSVIQGQLSIRQLSIEPDCADQSLNIIEITGLDNGLTLQMDGQQNIEYIPGMQIYPLIPRNIQYKPTNAIEKIQLAVALLQHAGYTTIFKMKDYDEFCKQFSPEEFTNEGVKQVAKASGLLLAARYIPKIMKGIQAVRHSMPEIMHAGQTIARNYQASTAPSSIAYSSTGYEMVNRSSTGNPSIYNFADVVQPRVRPSMVRGVRSFDASPRMQSAMPPQNNEFLRLLQHFMINGWMSSGTLQLVTDYFIISEEQSLGFCQNLFNSDAKFTQHDEELFKSMYAKYANSEKPTPIKTNYHQAVQLAPQAIHQLEGAYQFRAAGLLSKSKEAFLERHDFGLLWYEFAELDQRMDPSKLTGMLLDLPYNDKVAMLASFSQFQAMLNLAVATHQQKIQIPMSAQANQPVSTPGDLDDVQEAVLRSVVDQRLLQNPIGEPIQHPGEQSSEVIEECSETSPLSKSDSVDDERPTQTCELLQVTQVTPVSTGTQATEMFSEADTQTDHDGVTQVTSETQTTQVELHSLETQAEPDQSVRGTQTTTLDAADTGTQTFLEPQSLSTTVELQPQSTVSKGDNRDQQECFSVKDKGRSLEDCEVTLVPTPYCLQNVVEASYRSNPEVQDVLDKLRSLLNTSTPGAGDDLFQQFIKTEPEMEGETFYAFNDLRFEKESEDVHLCESDPMGVPTVHSEAPSTVHRAASLNPSVFNFLEQAPEQKESLILDQSIFAKKQFIARRMYAVAGTDRAFLTLTLSTQQIPQLKVSKVDSIQLRENAAAAVYNYQFAGDVLKHMTALLQYVVDVTGARSLHLHFEDTTNGFSFAMAVLAMVLGMSEDYIYTGAVSVYSNWMAAFDTPLPDISEKITGAQRVGKKLYMIIEMVSFVTEVKRDPSYNDLYKTVIQGFQSYIMNQDEFVAAIHPMQGAVYGIAEYPGLMMGGGQVIPDKQAAEELREARAQMKALREYNANLEKQVKESPSISDSDRAEIVRLRAENANLRTSAGLTATKLKGKDKKADQVKRIGTATSMYSHRLELETKMTGLKVDGANDQILGAFFEINKVGDQAGKLAALNDDLVESVFINSRLNQAYLSGSQLDKKKVKEWIDTWRKGDQRASQKAVAVRDIGVAIGYVKVDWSNARAIYGKYTFNVYEFVKANWDQDYLDFLRQSYKGIGPSFKPTPVLPLGIVKRLKEGISDITKTEADFKRLSAQERMDPKKLDAFSSQAIDLQLSPGLTENKPAGVTQNKKPEIVDQYVDDDVSFQLVVPPPKQKQNFFASRPSMRPREAFDAAQTYPKLQEVYSARPTMQRKPSFQVEEIENAYADMDQYDD